MTGKTDLSNFCLRAAKGLAAIGGALVAFGASGGAAMADDNISIYFVGCAAPTGFHGYLARGAEEAGKNLGVKVTYIYPDTLTIPNQVEKIEEAIAAKATASRYANSLRTRPTPTSPPAPRRPESLSAAPPRRRRARKCAIPMTFSCSAPGPTRRPRAR